MKNGFAAALSKVSKGIFVLVSLLTSMVADPAAADPVGRLKIFRNAAGLDSYYANYKTQIQSLYDALEVYSSPYSFDPNLSWYSNGFFYQDLEAIYVGGSVAAAHPNWIMKDVNGNNLYINWGCSGGTCPAYMADLGNPDFRAYWVSQAQQTMAKGYTAIFVDDASMIMRASDGNGNPATMIDPRTGNPVTLAVWQGWNLTFFQQIRSAFPAPTYRIMQNVTWFSDTGQATPNPLIDQQIKLLDYFYLEFGIDDPGVTGGDGQFSMQKQLDMLMRVKADGANFNLGGATSDEPGKELNFAFAMLATDGNDFIGDDTQFPNNPVPWYHTTNLGAPLGTYFITSQGVYERDFQFGSVIVNPPGAGTVTVKMPGFQDMQGDQNTFTLGPKTGKVLFGTPPCTALTFQGGTVPTTPVARGSSYTLTCNYGAVVDTILAYSAGNRCTYQSFLGNAAQFTCAVPATGSRILTNTCSLVAGGRLNTCPLTNSLPNVVVAPPASDDFNGDGFSDIAWRDTSGNTAIWLMNGTTVTNQASSFVGNVGAQWGIVGQRDFNGDGKADLLWRDTSGNVAIWEMNGTTVLNANSSFVANVPTNWSIVGTGDFNGDGMADILWRDTLGNVAIWEMNGTTILNQNSSSVANVPGQWSIKGTGDFNGDGMSDILWQDTSGNVAIWLMNGTSISNSSSTFVANVPSQWSIKGTGDFDGDGKSDIIWRDSAGDTLIWLMNGTAVSSAGEPGSMPTTSSIAQTGDYDGDGKSDLLWRDTSGNASMWMINGTTLSSTAPVGNVPMNWTVQSTNAE